MTENSWSAFANQSDTNTSHDQVLKALRSHNDIKNHSHLNTIWSHWRDHIIQSANQHIPYIDSIARSTEFLPKNIKDL